MKAAKAAKAQSSSSSAPDFTFSASAPDADAAESESLSQNLSFSQQQILSQQPTQPHDSRPPRIFQFSTTAVGLKHYDLAAALELPDGARVCLLRQTDNLVDQNAIQVCAETGSNDDEHAAVDEEDEEGEGSSEDMGAASLVAVGMLEWRHAHDLAPHLDSGLAQVVEARVTGRRSEYELSVSRSLDLQPPVLSSCLCLALTHAVRLTERSHTTPPSAHSIGAASRRTGRRNRRARCFRRAQRPKYH